MAICKLFDNSSLCSVMNILSVCLFCYEFGLCLCVQVLFRKLSLLLFCVKNHVVFPLSFKSRNVVT